MSQLSGKTAIITGSTSGIGLAIARGFSMAGANIILNGLGDVDEIEKTRVELDGLGGGSVIYIAADMSDPGEIETFMAGALDQFEAVDIVVNCAGTLTTSPIDEFPKDRWNKIIEINLNSAFHVISAAVPGMKKRGWGRIINIASVFGLVGARHRSAYISSKHGLVGLTKSVALELGEHGITCNAICPGYVYTPMVRDYTIPHMVKSRGLTEEEVIRDVLLAAQITKKLVTVEQISGVADFLCTDFAANITGVALPVDGGITAA